MTRIALLFVLGAAGLGCRFEGAFACETQGDCNDGDRIGFCEIDGYCSFSDDDCGSGRRYGEHAPDDLAGLCTPPPDGEPNFFTGSDESSSSTPELDSATAADDDGESSSEGPSDPDPNGVGDSSDDGSSSDDEAGEVGDGNGEVDGGEAGSGAEESSSSSGADEEPQNCDALDCDACLDCVAQPNGPCADEASACEATDGCTAGVACKRDCLLTGLCFEDCCYPGAESQIDDAVMCGADHCLAACNRYEFLTCG